MIPEITAAIAGLKAAGDLGALMLKIKVDSAITDKVIESQAAIFSAQSAMIELQAKHQELLDETDTLKKQLIEMEDWKAESQKYSLIEMVEGVFVYALKPDQKDTAPPHWLCPNCYQNKKKSILQFEYSPTAHNNSFKCSQCSLQLVDHTNGAMPRLASL
jgi:hypothetical protein